jgi:hypothetical protein
MAVPSTVPLQHNTWVSYQRASCFFVVFHQQHIQDSFQVENVFKSQLTESIFYSTADGFSLFPNLPFVTKVCQRTFILFYIFLYLTTVH